MCGCECLIVMYGHTRAERPRTTHVPEGHHKRVLARLLCSSSHVGRVSLRCEGATSTTHLSPVTGPPNTPNVPTPATRFPPNLQPPPPAGEGRIFGMSRLGVAFVGGGGEDSPRGVLVWGYRRGEVPHGHGQEPRVPRDCLHLL